MCLCMCVVDRGCVCLCVCVVNHVFVCVCVCVCSVQDVRQRMSLSMDLRLPSELLQKLQLESQTSPPPTPACKPLSRVSRRASLVGPVTLILPGR